jgi:hypothetical protein
MHCPRNGCHGTAHEKRIGQDRKARETIAIDDCTPPYLQDFIATRLAETAPELSSKVHQLSGDEMHELCEHIKNISRPRLGALGRSSPAKRNHGRQPRTAIETVIFTLPLPIRWGLAGNWN